MHALHCEKRGDQHLVFGWASVAVKAGGEQVEDLQGDVIDPEDLEKAAYEFVEYSGSANVMHKGRSVGRLVESLMVTPEKLKAMGLPEDAIAKMPQGHWVGFRVSPETFAKVKSGALKMFSIEGTATPEYV